MPIIIPDTLPDGGGEPALLDGQFELDGYRFGSAYDPIKIDDWDTGQVSWTTQTKKNPVSGGVKFGRDKPENKTWLFNGWTDGQNAEEALAEVERMEGYWRAPEVMETPGAYSTLRYGLAGRVRRVYGRGRRFYSPIAFETWQGVSTITADFELVDSYTYDDTLRRQDVSITPATTGGFVAPFIFPLTSLSGGERQGVIEEVGGAAETGIIATINGPIAQPWIAGPGWRLDIGVTLAYDQFLVIDTRPWANTVLRNDGASLAGSLSRSSLLKKARLKPGSAEIRFGGIDATGTASCSVAWRPAYNSL